MKLPRDLAGLDLAKLLRRFGYEIIRQTGSHLRMESRLKNTEHHITIPAHDTLKVGTLNAILTEVSGYLEISRADLARELFGD